MAAMLVSSTPVGRPTDRVTPESIDEHWTHDRRRHRIARSLLATRDQLIGDVNGFNKPRARTTSSRIPSIDRRVRAWSPLSTWPVGHAARMLTLPLLTWRHMLCLQPPAPLAHSVVVMSFSPVGGGKSAAPTQLAQFKAQQRTRQAIQTRGDQIQFIHDKLHIDLRNIEAEIKLDQAASEAYGKQLAKLALRKAELRKVIAQQEEFTINFDQQIGPFEARYTELQHSVDGLHKEAKVKYDAAVQLLVRLNAASPTPTALTHATVAQSISLFRSGVCDRLIS
jgi:hypothetical protein